MKLLLLSILAAGMLVYLGHAISHDIVNRGGLLLFSKVAPALELAR